MTSTKTRTNLRRSAASGLAALLLAGTATPAAAADRIGFPTASGAVTLDGVAGGAEWANSFKFYLEDGASVAAAYMRGMADANFVYLYFEAEDTGFDNFDAVVLAFNPTNAAANYKRMIIYPCQLIGGGSCPGMSNSSNLNPFVQSGTGSLSGSTITWGALANSSPAGFEARSSAAPNGTANRWGVEIRIAKANFPFIASDFFGMFADVIATDPGAGTAVQYSWPAGATIGADENDVFGGSLETAPLPLARWGEATLNPSTFPAGLQITGFGNSGADPTRISLTGPNTFYVTAANSPGASGPVADATGVTATFMINNIGLNPSWTWTNVPVGGNPTPAQTIQARQYMSLHADPWTLSTTGTYLTSGMSEFAFFSANTHQCIRVDLNHVGGSTISRYWNMNFVSVNSPFELQPQIATGAWRRAYPKARAVMLREVFLNTDRNAKWTSTFTGAKAAGEHRWVIDNMERNSVRLKTSVLAPPSLSLPGRQFKLDPVALSRGRAMDVAVSPGTVLTLLPDGFAMVKRTPVTGRGLGGALAEQVRARSDRLSDAFRGRAAIRPGALVGSFDNFRSTFEIGSGTTILVPADARRLQVRFADGAAYEGGNVTLQAIATPASAAMIEREEIGRLAAARKGALLQLAHNLPMHIVRGSIDTGTFVTIGKKKFRVAAPAGSYGEIVRSVRGLSGAPRDLRVELIPNLGQILTQPVPRQRPRPVPRRPR